MSGSGSTITDTSAPTEAASSSNSPCSSPDAATDTTSLSVIRVGSSSEVVAHLFRKPRMWFVCPPTFGGESKGIPPGLGDKQSNLTHVVKALRCRRHRQTHAR